MIFLFAFLISGNTFSQMVWKMKRYEAEMGIGGTFYMGDIGTITHSENLLGLKDLAFRFTRPVIHAGFRYKLYRKIAVKVNLNLGWLHGDDKYGSNDGRGFVFTSTLFESSLQGEYYIISDKSSNNYLMMKGKGVMPFASFLSLYTFAGIGTVFSSPKVVADPYNRAIADPRKVSLAFPLGVGLKYGLTPKWKMGFELGIRYTRSDEIDAFTSQYSQANDVYYFATFHATYLIKTARSGWPSFKK